MRFHTSWPAEASVLWGTNSSLSDDATDVSDEDPAIASVASSKPDADAGEDEPPRGPEFIVATSGACDCGDGSAPG